MQGVFFPAVAVCWLAWLAGQVVSYCRSSGERRLHLKWLRDAGSSAWSTTGSTGPGTTRTIW